jgi:hypothetical protein
MRKPPKNGVKKWSNGVMENWSIGVMCYSAAPAASLSLIIK